MGHMIDSASPDYRSRVLGLLLGGAAGDALGYTVEFSSREQILARHPQGLAQPEQVDGVHRDGTGQTLPISDDTQMTLYVLDGLLEWIEWANDGQMADPAASVWLACLRWWRTQNGRVPDGAPQPPGRWIDAHRELHVQRAPGNACLCGLDRPDMGLPRDPSNTQSKGCGTVMRSAPYGMVPRLEDHLVVSLARQGAVLTHGHPAAWTSSAAFALMVSALMGGRSLAEAVQSGEDWLRQHTHKEPDGGTLAALERAVTLAAGEGGPHSGQDQHRWQTLLPAELGEGWVAEEALAIAVYAVLSTADSATDPQDHLERTLRVAITHSGDSDSTGSLAGQLLGAHYGMAIFGTGPSAQEPTWIREHEVIAEAARRWTETTD